MEPLTQTIHPIKYRRPILEDGLKLHQLIANSPPLDVNSSYLYFLQSSHFSETYVVAEHAGEIIGFVSGYLRPDRPDELFVWQLVVAPSGRGHGVAKALVRQLTQQAIRLCQQPLRSISCTISPSNHASQGVFKSLAHSFGLQLEVRPFLTQAHFAGQAHEPEDEYRLTAAECQPLEHYLAAQLSKD